MSDLPGWEIAASADPADRLIAEAVIVRQNELYAQMERRTKEGARG